MRKEMSSKIHLTAFVAASKEIARPADGTRLMRMRKKVKQILFA